MIAPEETPLAFVAFKGDDKIILRGWRYFTALNIVVLLGSIVAPFTAYLLVGWWLTSLATAWLVYAVWTFYRSALTEIVFGVREVTVNGEMFVAAEIGSFEARNHDEGEGMDDTPGRTEIWMTLRREPVQIALMSRHADGAAIVALLNAKLAAAARATL